MATITLKRKDGKITAYKFRAYLGRDEAGKQIVRYTTWYAPDHLTPSKARKAAEKAASAWEEQVKKEYENDCANSCQTLAKQMDKKQKEFSDFVLNVWFPICIEDGEHKPTTVNFYRYTANRLIQYFRGRAIQDITTIENTQVSNEEMKIVVDYIKGQLDKIKEAQRKSWNIEF